VEVEDGNSEIYKGTFNSVGEIKPVFVEFINLFTQNSSLGYCARCFPEPYKNAQKNYEEERNKLNDENYKIIKSLESLIIEIPIITLHNPLNWEYDIIGIVTAQTVTGTGFISEISSNWTDFFGLESNAFNKKIKDSEVLCENKLRVETVKKGGNAIIGTDIDYSEAGAGKGMLMVCMSGTAIKLKNVGDLKFDVEKFNSLENCTQIQKEIMEKLENFNKYKSIIGSDPFLN